MPKQTEVINNDPFCDVDLMPLEETKGRMSVVRLKDEAGNFRSIDSKGAIHGASYRLVPNTRVREIAEDVLTRTGMQFESMRIGGSSDATRNQAVVWDGKKYAQRWCLPEVDMQLDDDNSRLMLGVQAKNSYDGSHKFGLQFFMMACACSNQFHTGNLLGGFTFRHFDVGDSTLEEDIDTAINMIGNQADLFSRALPRLQWLRNQRVPNGMDGFLQIRKELMALKPGWRPSNDKHILDELAHEGVTRDLGMPQTADPDTLWGILNAYTAVTTHTIGGFRGVELSRAITDHFVTKALNTQAA